MKVNPGDGMQLGMHWPYCIDSRCSGCLPELNLPEPTPLDPLGGLDLSIFRNEARRERQSG